MGMAKIQTSSFDIEEVTANVVLCNRGQALGPLGRSPKVMGGSAQTMVITWMSIIKVTGGDGIDV